MHAVQVAQGSLPLRAMGMQCLRTDSISFSPLPGAGSPQQGEDM
jgi:hypothetical protein